ncbi:hypothetical protein JTE90_006111 [Oedothorax gibbosus]|uniref:Transposase n=1 Tax=Oedothorax gibbosus TaxID=931172 RepID=A0AAV6V3M4_9ARAC|nr:hypothetical protein JTE90_006111 [Oedothorax gibbosus]
MGRVKYRESGIIFEEKIIKNWHAKNEFIGVGPRFSSRDQNKEDNLGTQLMDRSRKPSSKSFCDTDILLILPAVGDHCPHRRPGYQGGLFQSVNWQLLSAPAGGANHPRLPGRRRPVVMETAEHARKAALNCSFFEGRNNLFFERVFSWTKRGFFWAIQKLEAVPRPLSNTWRVFFGIACSSCSLLWI